MSLLLEVDFRLQLKPAYEKQGFYKLLSEEQCISLAFDLTPIIVRSSKRHTPTFRSLPLEITRDSRYFIVNEKNPDSWLWTLTTRSLLKSTIIAMPFSKELIY